MSVSYTHLDSGLGGLTCIPNLMKTFPKERIIYFGDTARTPYGSKATSTIKSFSLQIADFLVRHNVKMIVIACNTVSATCLSDLQERYPDVPVAVSYTHLLTGIEWALVGGWIVLGIVLFIINKCSANGKATKAEVEYQMFGNEYKRF